MKIKITYILIGIFIFSYIGLVSSQSNEEIICDYSEQFLREHIILLGFDYSQDDIVNLTTLINVYLSPNIPISTTELYLKNFEAQCNRTNPIFLKKNLSDSNFTFIKKSDNNISCSPSIGERSEIDSRLFSLIYDMDWYIPFFRIDIGEMSCSSINFWSWIFKYQDNGEDFYTFKGFKLWWIVLVIFIYLVYVFILKVNRQNKKLNKVINKKLRE